MQVQFFGNNDGFSSQVQHSAVHIVYVYVYVYLGFNFWLGIVMSHYDGFVVCLTVDTV